MDLVIAALLERGFSARLLYFSALDRICGLRPSTHIWVGTDADLADLSRTFGELRFPGPDIADAALDVDDGSGGVRTVLFRCLADYPDAPEPSFSVLDFSWDAAAKRYVDPGELYPLVRRLRDGARRDPSAPPWYESRFLNPGAGRHRAAAEAALLLARYRGVEADESADPRKSVPRELVSALRRLPEEQPLFPEEQRFLLAGLMTGRRADAGLRLLESTGFLDAHWPELAAMDDVDHSKEFHPEGNVWDHTLETFRYRKIADLTLSLGLLLHDSGKPMAESSGGRRFDRHAELGELAARGFLARLGFPGKVVEDVSFLVRHHMMPAALPRLPLNRTQAALESPLFPLLLELYRCDESSSFKDQGGFYDSCAAYRTYLRNVKNPYRSADGKKLMKRLFS